MTVWDYLICDNKLPEGVQMDSSIKERYQVDHSDVGGYYADMNLIKIDKDWRVLFSCVNPLRSRPAHDFMPTTYTGLMLVLDNCCTEKDSPGLLAFECVNGIVVLAESYDRRLRRERKLESKQRKAEAAAKAGSDHGQG